MKHIKQIGFIPFILLLIWSCQPKPRPIQLNKFKDINLQKIYTFQYDRNVDSLIPFLTHSNPDYRANAALSFASIQDSNSARLLYPLLSDKDSSVRINSAYALGQSGGFEAEQFLVEAIITEVNSTIKATQLEALGRVADYKGLNFLLNYEVQNNTEKSGLAWGIYRTGLRKINHQNAGQKMLDFADKSVPFEARLAAGHYFYRLKLYPDKLKNKALQLSQQDAAPEIRNIYTKLLSGFNETSVKDHLIKVLSKDSVYNVRIAAINALKTFDSKLVYNKIWDVAFKDKHQSVRLAAAHFIADSKQIPDIELINRVQTEENEIIRAVLLKAFMASEVYEDAASIALNLVRNSKDRFEKQVLMDVLLSKKAYQKTVFELMQDEDDRDYILSVATVINHNLDKGVLDLPTFYSGMDTWLKMDNPYLSRQAAWMLCKPGLKIDSQSFLPLLKDALNKHGSYKDHTVMNAISKTIEVLSDTKELAYWEPEYFEEAKQFKTFNWNKIVTVPKDLKIDVYTKQGKFTMQLMVEDAPFSVIHFIELVQEDFFEGSPFYRVIPNYVKQAGGATQAALDKLASERIRSEFNRHKFRSYTVVMASYGKDTETSHFAIMISPAPWNDNKYTVFAKITDHFEVVQKLMPGDLIYGMEILSKYKI